MKLVTKYLNLKTKGNADMIDITCEVEKEIAAAGLKEGQVTVFVHGSTAGLTTIEFEPNLVKDFKKLFERIAPEKLEYAHHMTWGDYNGHSHVRASLLGPSLTVPFKEKRLALGTWQQIVLIDFDTSGRARKLSLQIIGI